MTVGYLADTFDLINVRDLDLIAQAGALCSRLVVGVYSDDDVERRLGRRPVVPLAERVALVSHVRGVHETVVHGDADQDETELVFVPGDRPVAATASDFATDNVVLTPRRTSLSAALRLALAGPAEIEAVA